jgi:predicted nucleotidyltransferase
MTLEELKKSNRIFFECRSGSFAYGTNTVKSDVDIRGLFYQPIAELISFDGQIPQISDERNDIVYYSLRRYLELACDANPNILEVLYMPDDCVISSSTAFEVLKSKRNTFISKKCIQTHQAYALAQIKKAKGRNKWINNPQPKDRPSINNFCYYLNPEKAGMPFRPVKFSESAIFKESLRCSSVEHNPGLYRVYKADKKSPIFTDDSIICSSIPKDEEISHNIGLLYVNADAYKRALTDHKNYWSWIKLRNPERWKQQEKGDLDFDSKNMQHTMRLMLTAEHILENGEPVVRFSGDKLQLLFDIRNGKFTYEELISMADDISAKIENAYKHCKLPDEADKADASRLLLELSELLSLK